MLPPTKKELDEIKDGQPLFTSPKTPALGTFSGLEVALIVLIVSLFAAIAGFPYFLGRPITPETLENTLLVVLFLAAPVVGFILVFAILNKVWRKRPYLEIFRRYAKIYPELRTIPLDDINTVEYSIDIVFTFGGKRIFDEDEYHEKEEYTIRLRGPSVEYELSDKIGGTEKTLGNNIYTLSATLEYLGFKCTSKDYKKWEENNWRHDCYSWVYERGKQ